ncbi:hypothetical protein D3C72_1194740 [compost metagenome]
MVWSVAAATGLNGKRPAAASCASAEVLLNRLPSVPMAAAAEPKASTPPRKPRREIAVSTTRSKSVSAGGGFCSSSHSSQDSLLLFRSVMDVLRGWSGVDFPTCG